MPEAVRYLVEVETRVVVKAAVISGGSVVVGEYTVRGMADGGHIGHEPSTVVVNAVERAAKAARTMAAGVDNTERNRRK
jgi:hypothetical protein